jgi:predicted ATP-grasp superfamily ATP-dependent carboligase/GNAT superfamily N-acetyltransferase
MEIYKNKAIVLGISANGLGIARSLGRRGVDVAVVSDTDSSTNLYSRYISERWFFYGNEKELVDDLLSRGPAFAEKPVLFPIRDATVLALAEKLEEIKQYYHIVMPPLETVNNALCKTTFAQLAEKFELPVPRSFSIGRGVNIADLPEDIKFPVIVKPEYRNDNYIAHVSGKAFKAENIQELNAFYAKFSDHQAEAIIQEYIPGGDSDLFFCFQYYTTDQSLACSLSGRKIRQYPSLCGSTCSCEVVCDPQVEELTTAFFSKIGYVGPCSMEFKRDPRDGAYYFIEPTIGRHDWNNAFGEGNGFPMPYINYLDAVGAAIPQFTQKRFPRRWIRWSADFETAKEQLKNGDISFLGWIKSIRPPATGAIFAMDDPFPFVVKIYRRLLRISGKIVKVLKKKVRKLILFEKYLILSKKTEPVGEIDNEKLFFRQATKDDAINIALQYGDHFGKNAAEEINHRLSSGEVLIVGSFSSDFDDICYLAWLSRNDSFYKAASEALNSKKSICLYRIYVPDSHRNKGIGKYALSYIEKTFLTDNYEEILAFVHVANSPSMAMFKKREWGTLGSLYRLRLLGKELIRVALP